MIRRSVIAVLVCFWMIPAGIFAQEKGDGELHAPQQPFVGLHELQQRFIDLRFGMFIHFNIPTFMDQDWADPDASPEIFDPKKLDCRQWAKAAKSANMSYGCLTTKHHSGFCIWDTKTTDYNVMNSPLKRDVVREYVDAFRAQGLKTCLYYSILDTHHKLRPGFITRRHIDLIKAQLTELLTRYGEITSLIIDGWDAPWSRISYDDVPFEEIYTLVKTLQPHCLLMDLNSAKYPPEALMYTDIKSYEQGAGQHISKETNRLPALACLPLNTAWFWKTSFPTSAVKDPKMLIGEDIVPYNKIFCNFILNVAPNRDGLIDDNSLAALQEIGHQWNNSGPVSPLPPTVAPIISSNIAKHQPANSSWSDDMNIMDFGNDDNFHTSWNSNVTVKAPWYEVEFDTIKAFNAIVLTEDKPNIRRYRLEYFREGVWRPLLAGSDTGRVKIHRFDQVWGGKVRVTIDQFDSPPGIAEFGVYNERRDDPRSGIRRFDERILEGLAAGRTDGQTRVWRSISNRAGEYSFPSGHTSSSFGAVTALSRAYPKWYVIAPSFLWAASVGYSRMYLGVHNPSDVGAGALLGVGSAFGMGFLRP